MLDNDVLRVWLHIVNGDTDEKKTGTLRLTAGNGNNVTITANGIDFGSSNTDAHINASRVRSETVVCGKLGKTNGNIFDIEWVWNEDMGRWMLCSAK